MGKATVAIISDPLMNEYGSCRPTILVAKELANRNFHSKIVTESVADEMLELCRTHGISVEKIGSKPWPTDPSLSWFKSWVSEALYSRNSRRACEPDGIVLNFSNTIAVPSKLWYAQGPPTVTLDNIKESLSWHYRLAYEVGQPFLKTLDKRATKKFSAGTTRTIANSKYLSRVYQRFGIDVHDVIYPPLDCERFTRRKSSSSDYLLTYFGKETKLSVVKKIADAGVEIRIFGAKMSFPSRSLRKHSNIKLLGHVSNEALVKLYSNALATLYPFLDEPFGYIPIESMACGTPVMTFGRQGPSESVVHNVTGWLLEDDESLMELALKIWKHGYSSAMRAECRKRALLFDKKKIAEKWIKLVKE